MAQCVVHQTLKKGTISAAVQENKQINSAVSGGNCVISLCRFFFHVTTAAADQNLRAACGQSSSSKSFSECRNRKERNAPPPFHSIPPSQPPTILQMPNQISRSSKEQREREKPGLLSLAQTGGMKLDLLGAFSRCDIISSSENLGSRGPMAKRKGTHGKRLPVLNCGGPAGWNGRQSKKADRLPSIQLLLRLLLLLPPSPWPLQSPATAAAAVSVSAAAAAAWP